MKQPEGRVERRAGLSRFSDADDAAAVEDRKLSFFRLGKLGEAVPTREDLVNRQVVIALKEPAARSKHERRRGGSKNGRNTLDFTVYGMMVQKKNLQCDGSFENSGGLASTMFFLGERGGGVGGREMSIK